MVTLAVEQGSGNICPRDGVWRAQGPMSTPIETQGRWGVLESKPEDVKFLLVILTSQEYVPLFSFLILLLSVLTLFSYVFLPFHVLFPPVLFSSFLSLSYYHCHNQCFVHVYSIFQEYSFRFSYTSSFCFQ